MCIPVHEKVRQNSMHLCRSWEAETGRFLEFISQPVKLVSGKKSLSGKVSWKARHGATCLYGGLRQVDLCAFKVCLAYIVSCRPARTVH